MLRSLAGVTRRTLTREIIAGATLLAISIPLNIGYAQIAGLPATAGLYALVVPTLVYVALVSSRQVVASPDAAAAALVFSSLIGLGVAKDDFSAMAAGQAIICGAVLLIAAVFRLGFLANFLSRPILVGFVAGLALEVMLSQVRKMLGLPRSEVEGFFRELVELIGQLDEISLLSLALSAVSVAALLLGRRVVPRAPAALIVLVVGTIISTMFDFESHGVAVLGAVTAGSPQFAVPLLSINQWISLIPSALALAMITMAEGVLISRSYAQKRGYRTDADQDLRAFGAANIAAGFSMSFAVGSSTSRSAAMDQIGSRSQMPSVVLAGGAVLLLLYGTELLAQIPAPLIGAVVAVAVVRLLGVAEFRELAWLSRYEFAIGIVCLLGVLLLGPLKGLLLAFALSLVNLARRAANPRVEVLSPPPVVIARFAGPVFFANAGAIVERIQELASDGTVFALVIDAEGIGDIDVTGADALRRELRELSSRGVIVGMARLRPGLRDRMLHLNLLEGVREFTTNHAAKCELDTEWQARSGEKSG